MINPNINLKGLPDIFAPGPKTDTEVAPAPAPPPPAAPAEAAETAAGGIEAAGQLGDQWSTALGDGGAPAEAQAPAAAPAPAPAPAPAAAPPAARQGFDEAGLEALQRSQGASEDSIAAGAEHRAYLAQVGAAHTKPDSRVIAAIYARHGIQFDPLTGR